MYHYIRLDDDTTLPYINKISSVRFFEHLDYLENNYRVLSPEEFIESYNNACFPENSTLLTFDDGLSDHYNIVFPELQKRKLTALFFVSTRPFLELKMLQIHKTHHLFGKYGYIWLKKQFEERCNPEHTSVYEEALLSDKVSSAYPYDNKSIAEFKYLINYLINKDVVDSIISAIFAEFFDEKECIRKFYLSESNIVQMIEAGMSVGLHGHSHTPFAQLEYNDIYRELSLSIQWYKKLTGVNPIFISYPFGDLNSVNNLSLSAVTSSGLQYGFLAVNTDNTNALTLSRLDCVELTNKIAGKLKLL